MVAIIAEKLVEQLEERFFSGPLAEVIPFPNQGGPSRPCLLLRGEQATPGEAKDISRTGARMCELDAPFHEGERLFCQLHLGDGEPPLRMRCKVVRAADEADREVEVRFLELGFNEWFRLGRFAAAGRAPMRPSSVLMPPA